MSGEKDGLISGAEEALYKLSDRIRFNQLVDQVEKISFGYNPDYTDHSDDTDDCIIINLDGPDEEFIEVEIDDEVHKEIEARIIAQLGVYGLRTALDHPDLYFSYDLLKDQEHASEMERVICPDTILRLPLLYNQPPDLDVVRRAEQFGEVLLDKAFVCLGPDAPQKAREISEATTEEEQEKSRQDAGNQLPRKCRRPPRAWSGFAEPGYHRALSSNIQTGRLVVKY